MLLSLMALAGAMVPGAVVEDGFDGWNGDCAPDSHTVEGGERRPFPCNALIHVTMPADPGHQQLIFVIKGQDGKKNGVMLSFGGRIDGEGVMQVERVQFTPAKSTPMAPGSTCAITREGAAPKHIRCNVTASDGSGRSASLNFAVSGKIAL